MTAPKRRTSASATAFTVAWALPWHGLETTIAIERLLDFMPRYEVKWDGLEKVHMQNVAGYHHVPVRVLR